MKDEYLQVSRIKGTITLSGSVPALRYQAVWAGLLETTPNDYTINHYIFQKNTINGEFQIFHDFYHRVSEAQKAAYQVRQHYPAPRSLYEEDILIERIQSLSDSLAQQRKGS